MLLSFSTGVCTGGERWSALTVLTWQTFLSILEALLESLKRCSAKSSMVRFAAEQWQVEALRSILRKRIMQSTVYIDYSIRVAR